MTDKKINLLHPWFYSDFCATGPGCSRDCPFYGETSSHISLSRVLPDIVELSLSLSCPETAKLALLGEQPYRFVAADCDSDRLGSLLDRPFNEIPPEIADPIHIWQLREAAIDIMQCRNFSVAGRILAVGMMLSKISETEEEAEAETVAELADEYTAAAQLGAFDNLLPSDDVDQTARAQMQNLLLEPLIMMGKEIPYNPEGVVFKALLTVKGWLAGDGDIGDSPIYGLTRGIDGLYRSVWEPFVKTRSHVLENYFVNYIFASLFPFSPLPGLLPYHRAVMLAEQYAMFRLLLLAGSCGKGIDDRLIVETAAAMTLYGDHALTAERVSDLYLGNDIGSLAHLSLLLKD